MNASPLANGQGGQVVFGVTPGGKVVGQKVTDRTLEEFAQEFQGFQHATNRMEDPGTRDPMGLLRGLGLQG